MSATASKAIHLYRQILRLHRTKLPAELRQLGDAYVRDEFNRHKAAKPQFLVTFFKEWDGYVQQLSAQGPTLGAPIDAATVEAMTPEQKERLAELQREATSQR